MTQSSALSPEIMLAASGSARAPGLLGAPAGGPDPTLDELVSLANGHQRAWGITLAGGEPTTRADLPRIVQALASAGAPNLGLLTDGVSLSQRSAATTLKGAGVCRLTVNLHSYNSRAHDWLTQVSGSAKRARMAIKVARAVGLNVRVRIVLTRSTTSHLVDTVKLAAAIGAHAIQFTLPSPAALGRHAVAVAPRYGLVQPHIEEAARVARGLGLEVLLTGVPRCVAPLASRRPQRPVIFLPSAGVTTPAARCAECPSTCCGSPASYAALFGFSELESVGSAPEPRDVRQPDQAIAVPAPRGDWRPATRVSASRRRVRSGRPWSAPPPQAPHEIAVLLLRTESTKQARIKLLRAAQQRPRALRLTGEWVIHPAGLRLLAEARYFEGDLRLVGLIHPLDRVGDRALERLAINGVWALLLGPDAPQHDARAGEGAFAATLNVVGRLRALGVKTHLVTPHNEQDTLMACIEATQRGALPLLPSPLNNAPTREDDL